VAGDPNASTNNFLWVDAPTVGFNKDWIVVQANMFRKNITFDRSHFWVFNKTNLYAGDFTTPTLLVHADTNAAGSELPAISYDNTSSTLYLLQNANGNTNGSGYLRLFSITGSIGSEKLNYVAGGGSELTNAMYITVPNISWIDTWPDYAYPCSCFLPQKTVTNKLAPPGDARLTSVIYRNGSLWCAQTVLLPVSTNAPTRSAVQWWQIKPDNREIVQRGRIDDPAGVNFYAYPSIAVNRFGDVLVGFNVFSTNIYASAGYSFRAFNDTCEGLRAPYIYQPGQDVFKSPFNTPGERWGDYSTSAVDPLNDADFWTIQEYALTNRLDDIGDPYPVWGTRWAQLRVDVPGNDNFSAAFSISGAQGSTNGNNIRATKETGEPNHAGIVDSVSVWYRWTAPTNGNVLLSVSGDFDNALAVYTGTNVASLTLVASNHGGFATGFKSQVVFNASAGTAYQIAVDGFGQSPNNQGSFILQWTQPMAPLFTVQPRNWDVYMGSNITFSAQAIGSPDPSFQWRFNGTNISGAAASSYTRNNVQTNDTGDYTLVATNISGSATSAVSHLEVYSTQRALITEPSYSATNYTRFVVSGITGAHYVVQASTNLANWNPINTNITTFTNLDYDVTNYSYRFYRVLYQL